MSEKSRKKGGGGAMAGLLFVHNIKATGESSIAAEKPHVNFLLIGHQDKAVRQKEMNQAAA